MNENRRIGDDLHKSRGKNKTLKYENMTLKDQVEELDKKVNSYIQVKTR